MCFLKFIKIKLLFDSRSNEWKKNLRYFWAISRFLSSSYLFGKFCEKRFHFSAKEEHGILR